MSQAQITAKTAGQAAAEWWAEQIGSPIHKIVRDDATGKDRETGDFAFMAMAVISSRHPVSDDQGTKFAAALTAVVDERLAKHDWLTLAVDYGPDRELAEAADGAGINYSRFPFKTCMWVKSDHVTASLGYHGPTRLIWNAPDWVRPACGNHRYDGEWNPFDEICPLPRYHEVECGDWVADPARCMHCGESYSQHYGKQHPYLGHSWEPKP